MAERDELQCLFKIVGDDYQEQGSIGTYIINNNGEGNVHAYLRLTHISQLGIHLEGHPDQSSFNAGHVSARLLSYQDYQNLSRKGELDIAKSYQFGTVYPNFGRGVQIDKYNLSTLEEMLEVNCPQLRQP